MPRSPRTSHRVRVSLALTLALAAGSASGQTLNWNNANGGSASTAANWSPAVVPGIGHDLVFNIATALATMPITFNGFTTGSKSHTYRQESVTLTTTAAHTVSGGITVGDLSGDNATLVLTTGTLNSTGSVVIGDATGSAGTLNINDEDADLIINGAGADLFVGNAGDASMNVTGGAAVSVADQLIVGASSTSSPGMSISGQSAVLPFSRSTLHVLGTGQSRLGQGGDAGLTVSNGGLLDFEGDVVISNGSASNSTVTVLGIGFIAPATLSVAGDLSIGRNTSAAAAGTATLNINADGVLSVGKTLFVGGDPEGGAGTLQMGAGSTANIASLVTGAGGTLDLNGGELFIDDSLVHAVPGSHLVLGGPNNPTVTLQNGAQSTLDVVSATRLLTVGGGSASPEAADFDVRSGADLTIVGAGDAIFGESSGDDGAMIVNGAGSSFSMPAGRSIFVGMSGNGRFEAETGATATLGRTFVGAHDSGTGALLIEGNGTHATTAAVFVGGTNIPGGEGEFFVNANATLDVVSSDTDGIKVWPEGHAGAFQKAVLTSDKAVRVIGGKFTLALGGVLVAPQFLLENGGLLNVNPNIVGEGVIADADTAVSGTSTIDMKGDLTIGNAASAGGFSATGGTTIHVRGNTLTILDSNGSGVGNINLSAGAAEPGGVVIAEKGIVLGSNAALTGHGVVRGNVMLQFAGNSIAADGGGIFFDDGILTNTVGAPIGGAAIRFTNTGGYVGQGTINAAVVADSGSSIAASGNLTMGVLNANGVVSNGVLRCGDHIVTLIDSNGVNLGSKTELDGGTLIQSVSLTTSTGDTFQGHGGVTTNLLSLAGPIKPGDTDAKGPDTDFITSTGTIEVGPTSHYLCHIGPPGPGKEFPESDRLEAVQVGDTVEVAGGTLEVVLLPFYTPAAGDAFDVVIGKSGVVGSFATHTLPPQARVSYLPDRVRVHFCYPDCDGDQKLSIDDFICFQTEFALDLDSADCDGDGALSIDDFICFQTFFAVGC